MRKFRVIAKPISTYWCCDRFIAIKPLSCLPLPICSYPSDFCGLAQQPLQTRGIVTALFIFFIHVPQQCALNLIGERPIDQSDKFLRSLLDISLQPAFDEGGGTD